MKKILLFAALFMAVYTHAQKAAYTFGSGNTIDVTGHYHDASIVGAVMAAQDRFGNDDCALSFPGTETDYLRVDFHNDFNISTTGQFSVSAWYKGGSPAMGDFESLFEKYDQAAPYGTDYHLALYDINKPLIGGGSEGYAAWSALSPPFTGDIDGWNHVVGVYDNGTFMIYVNGYAANDPQTMSSLGTSVVNTEIRMGYGFEGLLDDVRFYDTAITDFDVMDLYNDNNSCALTLSTIEMETPSFTAYPNPCSDYVTIDCTSLITSSKMTMQIIDVSGRIVFTQRVLPGIVQVNTQALSTGIYTLRVQANNGIITEHLVKN